MSGFNLRPIGSCLIICVLINLGWAELSLRDKAKYLSENNCELRHDSDAQERILLQASDVVLLGRAKNIEDSYGGKYSFTVVPHCIQKGNVSENEIVIRNLGKTKCGLLNVDEGRDYLLFLSRTSDTKIYDTMNGGARMADISTKWTPLFILFCGIKNIKKCNDVCPEGCSYSPPPDGGCLPINMTVTDTFNSLYPDGIPQTSQPITRINSTPKKEETDIGGGKNSVTTKPADDEVMAEPADEEVTAKPADKEVTAKPADEKVTSKPADEEVTSKPADEEVTAKPADEEVTSKPADEEVTSKPADEKMTAKPADKKMTAKPADEKMTAKPADEKNEQKQDGIAGVENNITTMAPPKIKDPAEYLNITKDAPTMGVDFVTSSPLTTFSAVVALVLGGLN